MDPSEGSLVKKSANLTQAFHSDFGGKKTAQIDLFRSYQEFMFSIAMYPSGIVQKNPIDKRWSRFFLAHFYSWVGSRINIENKGNQFGYFHFPKLAKVKTLYFGSID